MVEMEEEDSPQEEIHYEFELVETDDPLTQVLVCISNFPLTPEEYAQALISYANQIAKHLTPEQRAALN